MNYKKLSIDEQFELIKNKGIFVDEDDRQILSKINYYTLMTFKDIFYENKYLHKYKSDLQLSDLYKLYQIDNEIKKELLICFQLLKEKLINKIVDFFGDDFLEKGYLGNSLYNKNYIQKIYKIKLKSEGDCKNYYDQHQFLPIWVLLNGMDYTQFVCYIESLKECNYNKIFDGTKMGDFNMSKHCFEKIISGNKIYDFHFKESNINDILMLMSNFDINVENICLQYDNIFKTINTISKDDVIRRTNIKEVFLSE